MSNLQSDAVRDFLNKKSRKSNDKPRTSFYCGKELPISLRPILCKLYNLTEDCSDTDIFLAMFRSEMSKHNLV